MVTHSALRECTSHVTILDSILSSTKSNVLLNRTRSLLKSQLPISCSEVILCKLGRWAILNVTLSGGLSDAAKLFTELHSVIEGISLPRRSSAQTKTASRNRDECEEKCHLEASQRQNLAGGGPGKPPALQYADGCLHWSPQLHALSYSHTVFMGESKHLI